MAEPVPTQLMGALGGWLRTELHDVEPGEVDIATALVLDMGLLGVRVDDVDAPELSALTPSQLAVVAKVRRWVEIERAVAARRVAQPPRPPAQPQLRPAPVPASVSAPVERATAVRAPSAFSGALGSAPRPVGSTDTGPPIEPFQRRYVSDLRAPRPTPATAPSRPEENPVPVHTGPVHPDSTSAPRRPARSAVATTSLASATHPSPTHPSPAPAGAMMPVAVAAGSVRSPATIAAVVPDEAPTASSSLRRYEEAFWWCVCFLAVALILWRQLA